MANLERTLQDLLDRVRVEETKKKKELTINCVGIQKTIIFIWLRVSYMGHVMDAE